MELSSPVASLVPGLVDNAVVTFGDWLYWSAAIPFRRVPVSRPGPSSPARRDAMARNRRGRKAEGATLPVMRPDAAGIDIGATEIFVAVPPDRDAENVRSFP